MPNQHPLTPPPELVEQWRTEPEFAELGRTTGVSMTQSRLRDIATRAAQWGADQELEACCDTLQRHAHWDLAVCELMADRRPKPPSLKEQALEAAIRLSKQYPSYEGADIETIRRALEALDD